MNNYRFRFNSIPQTGFTGDLQINQLLLAPWDLNGVNESINEFENVVIQQSINPIDNLETIRYAHKPWRKELKGPPNNTSINYDFYFYSAQTDSSVTATTNSNDWVLDYRANGYTNRQIYYYEGVFSKSYFKLDFYDGKKSTKQQILLTIIIPTQQGQTMDATIGLNNVKIRKPKFSLNQTGDKEGYYVYWLKKKEFIELDTLYMSCKYYDANIGQFKRMMNVSQGELKDKFNFSQETYFYYTLKLNYDTYEYEVYLGETLSDNTRVGTESKPIVWYEYLNP